MSLSSLSFKVHKTVLPNGLTVLVKPVKHIPRVEAHLWYNVGSKDEGPRERGMAHLIEHMIFKGTRLLSESDINLVCQKLAGDANAFTSQDYTCYTFRLPSQTWTTALAIFAECMQSATFDKQMLASELKAVIEELRMYRDDFQGNLLEQMLPSIFPGHPYSEPIIGSKFDLCALDRDMLYAFYKKHYHPGNAVLVVVGDVTVQEAFDAAVAHFGSIASPVGYVRDTHYFNDDVVQHATTLYRSVSSPWFCYAYPIPGFQERSNHVVDVANLIIAAGKSSRLYRRLVEKERLAVDVDCSVYDFFERGLLNIGVWPAPGVKPEAIEKVLEQE
jgi:zinc protease